MTNRSEKSHSNGKGQGLQSGQAPPEDIGTSPQSGQDQREAAERFAQTIMLWAMQHRASCTCTLHPGSPINIEHIMNQSFAFLTQQHPNEFQIISTLVQGALKQANAQFLAARLAQATTPSIQEGIAKLDPEGKIPDLSRLRPPDSNPEG